MLPGSLPPRSSGVNSEIGVIWRYPASDGGCCKPNKCAIISIIGCAPLLRTTQGGCYDVTLIIEGMYK